MTKERIAEMKEFIEANVNAYLAGVMDAIRYPYRYDYMGDGDYTHDRSVGFGREYRMMSKQARECEAKGDYTDAMFCKGYLAGIDRCIKMISQ